VATLIGLHLAQVERRIAELTRTHDVLIDLQRRAAAINPADCPEPEICSILTAPRPTPASKAPPASPAEQRPSRTPTSRLHAPPRLPEIRSKALLTCLHA
jgi:hypothetical protein